jgi:hypothetical protein
MITKLLEQAINEIKKLPEDQQNAIAARLLAELADKQSWLDFIKKTSGSIPDFPDRAPQSDYEIRNELE